MILFDEEEDLSHLGRYEKRIYRTRQKIEQACLYLILLNEIITTKIVSDVSGVSVPTVLKYRDIVSKYDGDMLIGSADKILTKGLSHENKSKI